VIPQERDRGRDTMEQSQTQKYLVIGLAVVALVLVGVIAWLAISNNSSQASATATNTPATTTDQSAPTGGATSAPSSETPFDAKTATKVPSGTDPKKFVDEYYAAVMKKDYTTAFKHLPAAKQTGSSPDALKQQIEGYGITGYSVTGATQQGDQYTVTADQVTSQYGTFSNTWVFVKDGNVWLVKDKAVTGMK
jgi:cytoskeletal protein RodZ